MTAVRMRAFLVGASLVASMASSSSVQGAVHLIRRGDGKVTISNDVGSGWISRGHIPSDAYLVDRKNAPTIFDETIQAFSRREGIDPMLVKSVMLIESAYNPRALSKKGACGLMQLMPATARRYGVGNAFDATENIRGGVKHLAELLAVFNGNIPLTLAAYNAGAGAVTKYSGIPPYAETREYVRRAMIAYEGRNVNVAFASMPFSGSRTPIGGTFRGVNPSAEATGAIGTIAAPHVSRIPRSVRISAPLSAPVKVHEIDGAPFFSNGSPVRRDRPLLGRVSR
ncbi:MAG: lytic transglycosylase domain-containing protein [Thermoanaerobaculia bacterium]